MPSETVAVLGAGAAGLTAAIAIARAGRRVLLVERDAVVADEPADAWSWERKGIPHFLQPHAFIPRGRKELLEHFPDVYASLVRAGARDIDVRPKLPGPLVPADDDLQYMAVRRPLLEWGLRKAARSQPGIEIRSGVSVTGVRLSGGAVSGVEIDGQVLDTDVVVDALGRRSPMREWLVAQSVEVPEPRRSDCGVIYYSRYFRVRPNRELPDGPWILSPRGDLGYMAFASFLGDNGTFAAVLAVPPGVPELKGLARERAFDAAVARIPLLARWANPDTAEPITPVLAMGALHNSILVPDDRHPVGWFPMGDALCHTDPVIAHGLSFALIHAREVARAVGDHTAPDEAFASYRAAVVPAALERYELASRLDEQRLRMWSGGRVDLTRSEPNAALFSVIAAGAVALGDPEVFRVYVRRFGLLDRTEVFDTDLPLKRRIEVRFQELTASPRPPAGPSREEMTELIGAAAAAG